MTNDQFAGVKAILDGMAKHWEQERTMLYGIINQQQAAFKKIQAIDTDEPSNGLPLAILIAQEAEQLVDW